MDTEVIVALIGALATIVAAAIGVIWHKRSAESDSLSSSKATRAKKRHRFDIFVSAPLAGMKTDDDIAADHDRIAPVVELLEVQCGFNVFWAGRNIRKRTDFEAADLSAKDDVEALLESKYYLLLYPEQLVSSVLFEAGIAFRECLTSIYFVRDRAHLPFLMAQASQAFSNVRIYEGDLPDGLKGLLQKHGRGFFEPRRTEEG